mmetsp:Transcript_18415/g.58713  ORF Transcript_18415/g.58713 Transcript_18415/m.58713 type:complete len:226 (-) Transcript_18415:534-1211(-)
MQSVATPFLAPVWRISCSRVTRTRVPEAPIGWPRLVAPPRGFTLAGSSPSSRQTPRLWAANASLASKMSTWSMVQPAFCRASLVAGTGPMPMIFGSTPALAYATTRPSGVPPSCAATDSAATTTAAAPSLMPDALPAVTVPSFLNAARSLPSFSAVAPGFGNSSLSKMMGSPFRCGMETGQISSAKRLSAMALAARACDSAAKASCSSRVRPYFSAMFSAVMPMW